MKVADGLIMSIKIKMSFDQIVGTFYNKGAFYLRTFG